MKDKDYFAQNADFVQIQLDSAFQKSTENQIIETYQQLLSFRLKEKNATALIYLDLQRLNYVMSHSGIENADSLYLNALINLENQFRDNEVVVEVLAEKIDYFLIHTKLRDNKKTAYEICASAIQKFPDYRKINLLKNIQKTLLQKSIQINHKDFVSPNTDLKINVESRNVNTLKLKVYRVNATANEYFVFKQNRSDRKAKYSNRQLIETREIKVNPDSNFGTVETNINLHTVAYGIYNFELTDVETSDIESVNGEFTVTDFVYMDRTNDPKFSQLYVLNRQTGQPQSKVKVSAFTYKWSVNGYKMQMDSTSIKGWTDKNGLLEFPYNINTNYKVFFVKRAKDQYFSFTSGQNYFSENNLNTKM